MSTIFWDFDGTLVYSHHLWSGSMFTALTAVDPQTTVRFSQIRECNTRGFTWQTPHLDYTALTNDAWWCHTEAHIYTAYLSCGVCPAVAATAASLVRPVIKTPSLYHLYPDTISTLRTLRNAGHRHVLLSNNYPDLEDVLKALDLMPLLDGIILSAVEGYDKPRAELFNIAKARFPDTRYYMIGDNPSADIVGGNQANMTTVLVHNGTSLYADYSAEDLHTVLSFIK